MANALAGNRIMCITWIAPDEYAASNLRDTLDDYMEFVRNSTPQEGPMRMIHSFFFGFTLNACNLNQVEFTLAKRKENL